MKTVIITLLAAISGLAQTTAYVMPFPNTPFYNSSTGVALPCVGCSLFSYTAGTTTPAATFTDSTGTTPNTNPIVLNSGGFNPAGGGSTGIWLNAGCYKFTLKDASLVVLWTVDHVCSGGWAPGGGNQQVQFDNAGAFGGSASLTWDGTTLHTSNLNISGTCTGCSIAPPVVFTGAVAGSPILTVTQTSNGGGVTINDTNSFAALAINEAGAGLAISANGQIASTIASTTTAIFGSQTGSGNAVKAQSTGSGAAILANNFGAGLGLNVASGGASLTGPVTASADVTLGTTLKYTTIYSAADTALPTCAGGSKGTTAMVSDANGPTFLGTYASGGAVFSPVVCNGTNWVTY